MAYITKEQFNYESKEPKVSQDIQFKKIFWGLTSAYYDKQHRTSEHIFGVAVDNKPSRYTNTELPVFSIRFKTSFIIHSYIIINIHLKETAHKYSFVM